MKLKSSELELMDVNPSTPQKHTSDYADITTTKYAARMFDLIFDILTRR